MLKNGKWKIEKWNRLENVGKLKKWMHKFGKCWKIEKWNIETLKHFGKHGTHT